MIDARVKELNRALKMHDSMLSAKRESGGAIHIYRETTAWDEYWIDGKRLLASRVNYQPVFALTHNWQYSGQPADWGIEPILARLRAIDIWNRPSLVEEILKGYEKAKDQDAKDHRNNTEAFLHDFRRQFAKTFNDVNTSTLDKIDSRRAKGA